MAAKLLSGTDMSQIRETEVWKAVLKINKKVTTKLETASHAR